MIPSTSAYSQPVVRLESLGHPRHNREEREQRGRCTRNGTLGPLALGLHTEVGSDLFKGDLHLPALDKPAQNGLRCGLRIGTQKGLGLELAFGITYQDPVDGHGRFTRVVPRRGPGTDLDRTLHATVPVRQRVLGSAATCANVGRRWPFLRGRPIGWDWRAGGGVYSAASRRKRVTMVTCLGRPANRSSAAKPASATITIARWGGQRCTTLSTCRARSVRH
jgi:hypothetical protein